MSKLPAPLRYEEWLTDELHSELVDSAQDALTYFSPEDRPDEGDFLEEWIQESYNKYQFEFNSAVVDNYLD